MNRINFAGYSNVIVDICKAHGTWFDRDELRRVIEFIRSGGLDTARQRELAELESRRRQLKDMQLAGTGNVHSRREELLLEHHSGISLISDALSDLFR